jgi:hypothetical protein
MLHHVLVMIWASPYIRTSTVGPRLLHCFRCATRPRRDHQPLEGPGWCYPRYLRISKTYAFLSTLLHSITSFGTPRGATAQKLHLYQCPTVPRDRNPRNSIFTNASHYSAIRNPKNSIFINVSAAPRSKTRKTPSLPMSQAPALRNPQNPMFINGSRHRRIDLRSSMFYQSLVRPPAPRTNSKLPQLPNSTTPLLPYSLEKE